MVSTTESLRLTPADVLGVFPEESDLTETGELTIGGCSVSQLAEEFGTPAYVIDEQGLRRQIRRFVDGLASRWPRSTVLFASKSLPAVAMYAIAESEGLGVDVAGGGELMMALAAGVDPARIYMHGNAKSDAEIDMALQAGIRCIIVDNLDELARLETLTTRPQAVMIRLTPGISPRTHASQLTGGTDSKFGLPREQVELAAKRIAAHPFLSLDGIHVHIGSQVLETEPFADAVKTVADLGPFETYDIGGGLGVQYTEDQPAPSVESYLDAVVDAARAHLPAGARLIIEPGRSLVARAGVSLYRVNAVKHTGKTFVAVDGGMADNLDIALTGQRYHAVVATTMDRVPDTVCDVVGRQCESGDLMVGGAKLVDPKVGDLVVIPVTGAYSYTMANHYNGAPIPPIVFCADGKASLAARRETYEDMLQTHQPAFTRRW
ncbi:diaminopimelate decarboxylase [Mycobacterium hodleri]|uniref:Diaminopimelate decarboxylase n=1 Tax=Mycolicibacterium hodleri TaxID=49897 RepID=A0A544VYY9_9MYCO|nr:diaminopimelate decarboxylase [Mycolicibacterium hodleri]